MPPSPCWKPGKLRLVSIERTPEELLDLEIAEAVAQLRGKRGQVPSRACYAIAERERFPGRVLARRVREAVRAGVARDAIRRAVIRPLARYIDRKYRVPVMTTGEFDHAA